MHCKLHSLKPRCSHIAYTWWLVLQKAPTTKLWMLPIVFHMHPAPLTQSDLWSPCAWSCVLTVATQHDSRYRWKHKLCANLLTVQCCHMLEFADTVHLVPSCVSCIIQYCLRQDWKAVLTNTHCPCWNLHTETIPKKEWAGSHGWVCMHWTFECCKLIACVTVMQIMSDLPGVPVTIDIWQPESIVWASIWCLPKIKSSIRSGIIQSLWRQPDSKVQQSVLTAVTHHALNVSTMSSLAECSLGHMW
jgi:hypothetical protein